MNILLDLDGVVFDTYGLIKTFGDKQLCDKIGVPFIENIGYSFNQKIWRWTNTWWGKIVEQNIPICYFDNAEWILRVLEEKHSMAFFTGRPSFAGEYSFNSLKTVIEYPKIFILDSKDRNTYLKSKTDFVKLMNPDIIIEDDVEVVNHCLQKGYKSILYYSREIKNTPYTKATVCRNWLDLFETIKLELKIKRSS